MQTGLRCPRSIPVTPVVVEDAGEVTAEARSRFPAARRLRRPASRTPPEAGGRRREGRLYGTAADRTVLRARDVPPELIRQPAASAAAARGV